jgi:hypothetical protein
LFSALIASSRQRADMPQAVHVYAQGTGETCLGQEYMFHRSRTSLHISSLQGESCNQRDNKKKNPNQLPRKLCIHINGNATTP